MAAAELRTNVKISEEIVTAELKNAISQECSKYKNMATDYLVMRDFVKCHQICINGISFTKQHPEETCAQICTESLCVLCIQALAEMDMWPAVLPLVQDTYMEIEACPYTVIQLCLLLHARVCEYSQCYAIASIWLRCKDNVGIPEYKDVVTLYIKHVMMPQDQLVLVPQFLNSCTVLSESEKEGILKMSEKLWNKQKNVLEEEERQVCPLIVGHGDNKSDDLSALQVKNEEDTSKESNMIIVAKRICSLLTRHMVYINLKTLIKVAIVAIGLSLLLKQTVGGSMLLNPSRTRVIWQGTLKTVKTMFKPYKPGR